MPPDLRRYLEDDEFVRPGRETALATEPVDLRGDGQQRVGRRLMGQVVEFRAGDPELRAAPPYFAARDPQQHLVQPYQRRFPLRAAAAAEHPQPFARRGVEPGVD